MISSFTEFFIIFIIIIIVVIFLINFSFFFFLQLLSGFSFFIYSVTSRVFIKVNLSVGQMSTNENRTGEITSKKKRRSIYIGPVCYVLLRTSFL